MAPETFDTAAAPHIGPDRDQADLHKMNAPGRDGANPHIEDHTRDKSCWREILDGALSGLYPSDQQLELMLDQLDRTP